MVSTYDYPRIWWQCVIRELQLLRLQNNYIGFRRVVGISVWLLEADRSGKEAKGGTCCFLKFFRPAFGRPPWHAVISGQGGPPRTWRLKADDEWSQEVSAGFGIFAGCHG